MGFTPIDPSQLDPIDSAVQTTFRAITPDQLDPIPTTTGRVLTGEAISAANALGFNFGDEAIAGGSALIDALLGRASISDAYDQRLKDVRSMQQEFRQSAGPVASTALDLGVGMKLPVGEGIKDAKTLGAKLLESAKMGGKLGAGYGFGGGEGLQNRLVGGGVGGVFGALLSPAITAGVEGFGDLVGYFTKSGQEAKAAKILREMAGEKGAQNIVDYNGQGEFGPQTYAEVAQTPGAANLESAVKQDPEQGTKILEALDLRKDNRMKSLENIIPGDTGKVTKDIRGQAIRAEAVPEYQAAEQAVNAEWKPVENQTFDVTGASGSILNSLAELKSPVGFSPEAHRVVDAAVNVGEDGKLLPHSLTVRDYQAIRSDAGSVMAKAVQNERPKEAMLMFRVREALDQAAEKAAASGDSGSLTQETADRFKSALAKSREFYQTTDAGVAGDIAKKGSQPGGFNMPDSVIPRKVTISPESAKEFAKAYGHSPEAMQQARAALIDEMTSKGQDTWPGYFKAKEAQFRALFQNDFPTVEKMINDLDSQLSVGRLNQQATGKGPITSQNVKTQMALDGKLKMLAKWAPAALGALVGGTSGLASGGVGSVLGLAVGKGVEKAAAQSESTIRNLLAQGIVDAKFAKYLLQLPISHRADVVSSYLSTQAGKLVGNRAAASSNQYQLTNKLPQPVKSQLSQGDLVQTLQNVAPTPTPSQAQNQTIGARGYNTQQIKQLVQQQKPIVQAVIMTESNGNPQARSEKGAVGLMQLKPVISNAYKVDPTDPVQNIKGGAAFLDYLTRKYPDQRIALAAFNAGETKVNAAIARARNAGKPINFVNIKDYLPREARNYPGLVLANLKQLTV